MAVQMSWADGSKLVNELADERHLARRIMTERKARGWSQVGLAKEMERAGSPIGQSAISKIEAPKPGERRGVTIGEAVGFAKAFDIPLGELLLPPDAVQERKTWALFLEAAEARAAVRIAEERYAELVDRVVRLAPDAAFIDKLAAQRVAVIQRTARQLRGIAALDGDPEDYYDAEDDPVPMVKAIDDVLNRLAEGTDHK